MVMLANYKYESVLKTLCFSPGLLMATINIQVQCPVPWVGCGFGYNLNWCVMIPEIQC